MRNTGAAMIVRNNSIICTTKMDSLEELALAGAGSHSRRWVVIERLFNGRLNKGIEYFLRVYLRWIW